MSTSPIDLSAGLQPTPPPATGDMDLSAGLQPAQPAAPAAPAAAPTGDDAPGLRGMANRLMDPVQGVGEGVMDSASSLAHILHAPKGATDFLDKAATPDNDTQKFFKGAEGITEFMMGDEALKGTSLVDRIPKVAKALEHMKASPDMLRYVAKAAAKGSELAALHPRTATVLASAARQAAVGTEQGVAHSQGDLGEGLKEGAIAGVAGGAIEGAVSGVGHIADAVKMGSRTIGGVEMPVTAEAAGKGMFSSGTTDANTPAVAAGQNEAAQQGFTNTAKRAVQQSADRANVLRGAVPPTEGAGAPPASSFDIPQLNSRGGYDGPADPSTDPAAAQQALNRFDEMDKAGAFPESQRESLDTLRQQIDMHHIATTDKYIDGAALGQNVTTYGDAASHLRNAAKPIYEQLDKLSAGDGENSFQNIKASAEAGQRALASAETDAQVSAAHEQIDKTNARFDELFDNYAPQGAGRGDWQAAKSLWHDASTLDRVHNSIEPMFNVSPETSADNVRLANGGPTRKITKPSLDRVSKLERAEGLPRLKQLLGSDGIANMTALTKMLQGPDKVQAFHLMQSTGAHHFAGRAGGAALVGAGVGAVGGGIVGANSNNPIRGALVGAGEGATAGGGAGFLAGLGARATLRSMATNGKVAQMAEYAVRHQVAHKIAAPLIAATMANAARADVSIGATSDQANQGAPPQ